MACPTDTDGRAIRLGRTGTIVTGGVSGRASQAFNRMIARLAHERSLAVGLKNDVDQVEELVEDLDFAVNESCVA